MFGNIIKSGLARKVVGHALADDPDAKPTDDEKITRQIAAFETEMAYFKMNLDDNAWFDYGIAGECAKPPPAWLPKMSKEERLMWLGDEEPLVQWLARV
jgi:hypothetical protein